MEFVQNLVIGCVIIGLIYLLQKKHRTLKIYMHLNSVLEEKFVASSGNIEEMKRNLENMKSKILFMENELQTLRIENEKCYPYIQQEKALDVLRSEAHSLEKSISVKNAELISLESRINKSVEYKTLKETGFFTYMYNFEEIQHYRESLQIIKELQRRLIIEKKVLFCRVEELAESQLIKSLRKIVLLAFNNEFELISERLSSTNFESCKQKIEDHFNFLNDEVSVFNCSLSHDYLELKVKELTINLEYEIELQKGRDEQAALKEQMRDEERAREEAELAREKAVIKEEKFADQLELARQEVKAASTEKQAEMLKRIAELELKLADAQTEREKAVSLAQITKKGHVYIISNIGSFGEEVFKIGVTRREDPMERVRELSDASVPFKFDVHAIVKSEDAPSLEASLHKRLDEHRLNRVNQRKEFFKVSLSRISEVCDELGVEITLSHLAEAREYRQSLELIKGKKIA
jgi:hypothetical protein